jgi:uncharacterized membrane protein YebE (DUF533 family)
MSIDEASRWWFHHEFNFSAPPPPAANELMLKAILICANGDGHLADQEREWVIGLAAMHGAAPALLDELRRYPATEGVEKLLTQEALKPFVENSMAPRALVYYAICAAFADGELHPEERATIHKMAVRIGVPKEIVEQLIALVELERQTRAMRLKLLAPRPPLS